MHPTLEAVPFPSKPPHSPISKKGLMPMRW